MVELILRILTQGFSSEILKYLENPVTLKHVSKILYETLEITNIQFKRNITDDNLIEYVEKNKNNCSRLEYLNVLYCNKLTDESIIAIAKNS